MRAALILASVLGFAACNMKADAQQSSGQREQRSYSLSGFDAVSLEGPQEVIVAVGPAYSVRAVGDREALERLRVEQDSRSLKIGSIKGNWINRGNNRGKAIVYVTMPALAKAAVAGSGDMRIDRVEGGRFSGAVSGSGDLNLAALRVNDAAFSIAGSGAIRAAGSAGRSSISVAGSGDVDLSGVETRSASVSIVGSGDVRARAIENASVSIMGSGDVMITGPAKCSLKKMGSGSLRCGA